MVTVQGDEVVLFSKKLGKRLVPRLASAYNYSRSDLAAYRFLCDLQHQSIQSNLTLDIQKYFPGLDHYPRVNYKQVILSPAKWLIPKAAYQQKSSLELALWLRQNGIDFLVKAGNTDQTLCFNPTSPTDLVALLHYCKQQGDHAIYIYEALIADDDCISDENDKKYVAEFVINYSHDKQIYSRLQPMKLTTTKHTSIKTQFLPGSEWLYFEIYLNPNKSNKLLCNEIDQLLKTYKNEIKQWFFIRYNENGKHLRLRLRIKTPNIIPNLLNHFNLVFEPLQARGIITEVILKTYNREVARYGAARMIDVEHFFYLDSKYVLSLLARPLPKNLLYQQTLLFLDKITSICFPLVNDRVLFAKEMANIFAIEFKINPDGFKKVNQTYQTLQQRKAVIVPQNKYNLKPLCDQAQIIFAQCIESEKSKMLADLIHMHINRLFNDYQRLEEAICYQFLYKQLLTERARLVEQSEHQFSA
jgi:thiopeptide-type bacteriocin biosynthesis protein